MLSAILAVVVTLLICGGDTPSISISDDGYWIINGEKTEVSVKGDNGGSSSADENSQGLKFYPQDDGTYIVSCGDAKYLSNIVIPATYKGGAVVGICKAGFEGCSNLTSIVIPESVTSIGDDAFRDCTSLKDVYITDVAAWCNISFSEYYSNPMYNGANLYLNGNLVTEMTIPDTVTSLEYTFCGCSSIVSVTIPDNVTSIGDDAFRGCTGLTSIVIPDSVTSIGDYAFSRCTGLTSIVIPDSITSISGSAFRDCTGLMSIVIPDSVETIGEYAFADCSNLSEITLGESLRAIGDMAFSDCTGLTSIVIPDSVTSIGQWAFSGCTGLTSIVIPDSVTSIVRYVFNHCIGLKDVYYTGTEAEWAKIYIDSWNDGITNATIHYNYVPAN